MADEAERKLKSFLAHVLVITVLVLGGWLGGFGEALLPEPWRGGVTGLLLALGGLSFALLGAAGMKRDGR